MRFSRITIVATVAALWIVLVNALFFATRFSHSHIVQRLLGN